MAPVTVTVKAKVLPTSTSLGLALMLKVITGFVTGVDTSLGVVWLISDGISSDIEEEGIGGPQPISNNERQARKGKSFRIIFLRKNCIPDQT